MHPRKKAPTPSGSTDEDSDAHTALPVNPRAVQIAEHIKALRRKRSRLQKDIETDHGTRVIELKALITKHYENEHLKRSELFAKKLEQLSKAIEKRRACEEAIQKLLCSLSDAAERVAELMNIVYIDRLGKTQRAVALPLR